MVQFYIFYHKKKYSGLQFKRNVQQKSNNPDVGYPDRLGPLGKSVENSTKLISLEITGYLIKYNTVLWLLELQIRRGRNV